MIQLMSRKARRENKKELTIEEKILREVRNISPTSLKAIKDSLRKQVESEMAGVMHCLYSSALNADFDFGTNRINKLIELVNNQFEGLANGSIDSKQVVDWCTEKKINFVRYKHG